MATAASPLVAQCTHWRCEHQILRDAMPLPQSFSPTQRPTNLLLAPAIVRNQIPGAQLQGSGVAHFLKLRIYEAWLWTSPEFAPDNFAIEPIGLEFFYEKNPEGVASVQSSMTEIRRSGVIHKDQDRVWAVLLEKVFYSLRAGDLLLVLHDGRGHLSFFRNSNAIAETVDLEFARSFLGIWLAPESSFVTMRRSLIGIH